MFSSVESDFKCKKDHISCKVVSADKTCSCRLLETAQNSNSQKSTIVTLTKVYQSSNTYKIKY